MSEKRSFEVEQGAVGTDVETGVVKPVVEHTGTVHLAEAAELYGNQQTAETYRYVARG
jgi:hypothetical protein